MSERASSAFLFSNNSKVESGDLSRDGEAAIAGHGQGRPPSQQVDSPRAVTRGESQSRMGPAGKSQINDCSTEASKPAFDSIGAGDTELLQDGIRRMGSVRVNLSVPRGVHDVWSHWRKQWCGCCGKYLKDLVGGTGIEPVASTV